MTTPEEAKNEVEAAFVEFWGGDIDESSSRNEKAAHCWAKRAFYAGIIFAADLNQEKIAQLIKEVD